MNPNRNKRGDAENPKGRGGINHRWTQMDTDQSSADILVCGFWRLSSRQFQTGNAGQITAPPAQARGRDGFPCATADGFEKPKLLPPQPSNQRTW